MNRVRPLTSSEVRVLWLLVSVFGSAYATYGLFKHWRFESSAYDLGIFDQAVFHLSRFKAPASSISGHSNILGDHFSPIIACFAPLYWVFPAPETLIVAQAFLFGFSIVPVFLYLRKDLSTSAVVGLSVAYGLFWGLQRAAAFDVHEVAFAPLIIASILLALERRRWALFWLFCFALIMVKEDLIGFLACLGLYLIVRGERWRGAVLATSSVVIFFAIVRIIVPALNDAGVYGYAGAFEEIVQRPWRVPIALVTPPVKLLTAAMWLAPFAFLPLGSPLSVLLIPFALSRFLSASELHWGTSFHYSAPLAPIVVFSAADALIRLLRRIERPAIRSKVTAWAIGCCVLFSALLPGGQPLWDLLTPDHYRMTELERTGYVALALIPPDASVVAQAAIAPHISQRDAIYMLDPVAPDAEFVIAAEALSPWPNESYDDIEALLEQRKRDGYQIVFDRNGWIVLRSQ